MKISNKKLYYKPIGKLTNQEFSTLFNINTDIDNPEFRKQMNKFQEYSIADIDISKFNVNEMQFMEAYLFGVITALKAEVQDNKLIVLFGESGCGKSHLIKLIDKIHGLDLDTVDQETLKSLGLDYYMTNPDVSLKELKEFADFIKIVKKKTTRPMRDNVINKPEIIEGVDTNEVMQCNWTYEMGEHLYGFSKEDIDKTLQTNNAIIIVNNTELILDLKKTYGDVVVPVYVERVSNQEQWKKNMMKDNRKLQEIEQRKNTFGYTKNIYNELFTKVMPEVIFNMPDYDGQGNDIPNHVFLSQLISCLYRNENHKEINSIDTVERN